MDKVMSKAKKWIDKKKDPRSACWQAGLETVMELFMPDLEKGRLTPIGQLGKKDLTLFGSALARVDLSPGLLAAFLPPLVAKTITPPESVEEWVRIDKDQPSCKIIIMRQGRENRILCAEISQHAHRPGVDIFQSGAFLGSFDYDTHDTCMSELVKVVRAHAWEKEKWQQKDYVDYTLNWFEKITYLHRADDVVVDEQHSFFHSPTLIRAGRVDALFLLVYEVLMHRFGKNPQYLDIALSEIEKQKGNNAVGLLECESVAENYILDLLNIVRRFELIDFVSFTKAENKAFKNEFVRTVRKVSTYIYDRYRT